MNNLTFKCINDTLNISLVAVGTPYTINLKFKVDNDEYQYYHFGDIITLQENQNLSFIGDQNNINFSKDNENYYKFVMDGNGYVIISGSINSLTLKDQSQQAPIFNRLFEKCSNIINASQLELPFNNLTNNCYSKMFKDCTSLMSAPSLLPAMTLAEKCYFNMFRGCSSLISTPELPALILKKSCYQSMFEECTNLKIAPTLPANNLVAKCYSNMFYKCNNLSNIEVKFINWSNYAATDIWLANVAKEGTFTKPSTLLVKEGNSYIPKGWTVINIDIPDEEIEPTPEPIEPEPQEEEPQQVITYTAGEGLILNENNQFSLTGTVLSAGTGLTIDNNIISLTATFPEPSYIPTKLSELQNDVGYLTAHQDLSEYAKIIHLPRKISDLNNDSQFMTIREALSTFAFKGQYPTKISELQNDVGVITENQLKGKIEDLINNDQEFKNYLFNIISSKETYIDFDNIENSISTPLTFIGKSNNNVISLTRSTSSTVYNINLQYSKNGGEWQKYNIGDLISLNKNDIVSFSGANESFSTNYTTSFYHFNMTGYIEAVGNIQSLLNFSNKTYKDCFNQLFAGCSSLIQAPLLPATILAQNCYTGMFWGCTSLSTAPSLPATELAYGCYGDMFRNCTSLTSAPQLPATTLATNCYQNMFLGCSNLSSIEVAFTEWGQVTHTTSDWLNDVAPTGIFIKPEALITIYRRSYIPSGWTVINKD